MVALWAVARDEAGAGGWAGLRASPMGSGPLGICRSGPWLPQMVPLDPIQTPAVRHRPGGLLSRGLILPLHPDSPAACESEEMNACAEYNFTEDKPQAQSPSGGRA